jgi:hypothetical protein
MNKPRLLAAVTAVSLTLIFAVSASAASTPTATVPTTGTPAPVPPAPPSSAAGQIKLVVQRAFGKPPFVIAGSRLVVRGIVIPYVGGQKVKVSFYREGRKVEVKTVSVLAIGNGAGQFHIGYSSGSAGIVQARAVHYATP